MNFKTFPLESLAKIKYGKNQKNVEDINGRIPIFGTGGLIGHANEYLHDKPSVLIGRKGSISKVKYIEVPFWTVDTLFYTEINEEIVIPKYLYYLMSLFDLSQFDEGTTIPSLTTRTLNSLEFNIPSLEYQKKAIKILSNFDKKINIATKINKNLENQLQMIFKSWFFEFTPFKNEKFIESKLGLIPTGWKVVNLGNVVTKTKDRVNTKDLKVLSAVKTGHLKLSEEYFTKQVFSKNIEKYIVVDKKGFAYNPARINIGSIGRNDFDFVGCVSPVYIVFKSEKNYNNFFDMYFKTSRFKQEVIVRSSGSVRQNLNFKDFSLIQLVYPPIEVIDRFNAVYDSLFKMQNNNTIKNEKLSKIRDILLPKLMSGEIDISEVKI